VSTSQPNSMEDAARVVAGTLMEEEILERIQVDCKLIDLSTVELWIQAKVQVHAIAYKDVQSTLVIPA
jgi:hypothetical protein